VEHVKKYKDLKWVELVCGPEPRRALPLAQKFRYQEAIRIPIKRAVGKEERVMTT
jgi:hypothetical protein